MMPIILEVTLLKNEFGEWGHDEIILEPTNKSYNSIIIDEVEADDFRVIGEFIGVLKEK